MGESEGRNFSQNFSKIPQFCMQILLRRQSRKLKGGLLTFFIAVTNSKNGRHVAITSTNSIRTAHMSATNQTSSLNQLESGQEVQAPAKPDNNLCIIGCLASELSTIPDDVKKNTFITTFS